MVANLFQPLILDVFKAAPLRDVEDEEDAVAALVEISRNRSERLLTGRIPNLQLDISLLANYHTEIAELDSNCDSVLLFKCLARQSFKNASFSDTSVAQDHNLEEHIEVVHDALIVRVILDGHSCGQIVNLGMQVRI